jgi:hypothetical protein
VRPVGGQLNRVTNAPPRESQTAVAVRRPTVRVRAAGGRCGGVCASRSRAS